MMELNSGAYFKQDVSFLLTSMTLAYTDVEEKERLIQSGEKHYSEMLSQEPEPTQWHLDVYQSAVEEYSMKMAFDVKRLAVSLMKIYGSEPIVLLSLVRAGVPLGVMLHRALKNMGAKSYHYGVSIIRDKGIDEEALRYVELKHGKKGIVFVDGWTGKGAITQQLTESLSGRPGYPEVPRLVVLTDPCGCAWLSASSEDWLIPFGIMGAPVSGLMSRSVWSEKGFHGSVECDHLKSYECGTDLVDRIDRERKKIGDVYPIEPGLTRIHHSLLTLSQNVVKRLMNEYSVSSSNRIKPGIAEATRAVLRRVPEAVLVRSLTDPDVALLVNLAKAKGIDVKEVDNHKIGQYRAVTIIKKVN
jgi:hypothetical protein